MNDLLQLARCLILWTINVEESTEDVEEDSTNSTDAQDSTDSEDDEWDYCRAFIF